MSILKNTTIKKREVELSTRVDSNNKPLRIEVLPIPLSEIRKVVKKVQEFENLDDNDPDSIDQVIDWAAAFLVQYTNLTTDDLNDPDYGLTMDEIQILLQGIISIKQNEKKIGKAGKRLS